MTIIYANEENCNVISLTYASGKITNCGILTKRMRNMWGIGDLATQKSTTSWKRKRKCVAKFGKRLCFQVKTHIKIPTLADTIVSNKGRYYGADDRTRTCTLARWNLNPMSLPIPPRPHIRFVF